MAKEGASFSSWRGRRSADASSWAIVDEVRNEKRLKVLDVGEGVKIPEPDTIVHAYLPYAEAWKQYDRLETLAKTGGKIAWAHWAWGFVASTIPLLAPHHIPRKDSVALVAGVAIFAGIQLLRSGYARRQFMHWQCPRCHSEWPGKKLEKEPRCATCGLKLHQMAP
jgi:hypothetical protein